MRNRSMWLAGIGLLTGLAFATTSFASPAVPSFPEFIKTSWKTGIENEALTVPGVEMTDILRGAREIMGTGGIHAMTGRLWQPYMTAEWRVGWNGSFSWPGGRTYGSKWNNNDSEHWGSHMMIHGGVIGARDFTVTLKDSAEGDPRQKTLDYFTNEDLHHGYGADGSMTAMDYTYQDYESGAIVLYTRLEAAQVTRWVPPQVTVNGEAIWENTATYGTDPLVSIAPTSDGLVAYVGKTSRGIVDPTLVSPHQLIHAWRMPLGVDVFRKTHQYEAYPDYDMMLMEYKIYNTGNMDRDAEIEHPADLSEFRVALGFQHYSDHITVGQGFNNAIDDDAIRYINPWPSYVDGSSEYRMAMIAYDSDGSTVEGPDYGDAYRKIDDQGVPQIGADLYAKAYIGLAYLFVPTEVGGATDDPSQPKAMAYSGENDFCFTRDYVSMNHATQYQAIWSGKRESDDRPVRDVPEADLEEEVFGTDKGTTSYHGLAFATVPTGQAVHFVHGVCAGGLDDVTSRKIAGRILDRDAALVPAAERMTFGEIDQVLSGEDSVLKMMDRMFWAVNGFDAEAGNGYDPMAKASAQAVAFNTPDPPRPPAAVWVNDGSESTYSGNKLWWTPLAAEDQKDFDTGIADFAGYRVYRAEDTPDSLYELVYQGNSAFFHDYTAKPLNKYYYYVTSYDDGSQNFADAGLSIESGKYWTWTGWGYYHAISTGYGVEPARAGNVSVAGDKPASLALAQNMPNPFNPITTIGYTIPTAGDVTLVVYNQMGQVVRSLVNGHVTAGTFNAVWDGKDNAGRTVASGTYLYRLNTPDGVKVRRMTLVK
jgi:hypothetical protein